VVSESLLHERRAPAREHVPSVTLVHRCALPPLLEDFVRMDRKSVGEISESITPRIGALYE
jgi:hypothetical protein